MTDLRTQIRDYTDHIVGDINVDDVFDRAGTSILVKAVAPRRRPWLVALASAFVTAFVTLLVVGGVVLVAQGPTPVSSSSLGDLREGWVEVAGRADLGLGAEGRLFRVIAGGPGFVATGVACDTEPCRSAIWVSADGASWSRVTDDPFRDHQIFDITAGGPGVVAVGSTCQFGSPFSGENVEGARVSCAPAVWVSPDGVTWTEVEDEETFAACTLCDAMINHVIHVGFGLVATGRGFHDGSAVWVSSDGFSWTRLDEHEAFEGTWGIDLVTDGVSAIGVGFLCDNSSTCPPASGTAATWISENGTDWTRHPVTGLPDPPWPKAFDVFGSSGVAVGESADAMPTAWTSTDWATWTNAQVEEGSRGTMLQIVVIGQELVAFGYEIAGSQAVVSLDQFTGERQQAIWLSADGQTWQRVTSIEDLVGGGVIVDIVHNDGRLVALATNPDASFISGNGAAIWIRPRNP